MNDLKIPFAQMQKMALQFGILPNDFWLLSLCEWRNCFNNEGEIMRRQDLNNLIKKYEGETK